MSTSIAPRRLAAHRLVSHPITAAGGQDRALPARDRGPLAGIPSALQRLYCASRDGLLTVAAAIRTEPRLAIGGADREFRHLVHRLPAESVADAHWEALLATRYGRPPARADHPSPRR